MKVMFDSVKSSSIFFSGKNKQQNNLTQDVKMEPKVNKSGFSNEEIYNGLMSFKNVVEKILPSKKPNVPKNFNQVA